MIDYVHVYELREAHGPRGDDLTDVQDKQDATHRRVKDLTLDVCEVRTQSKSFHP